MEVDSKTRIFGAEALVPQTIGSNTTTVGPIIDTQLFESLTFLHQVGDFTDGVYTITIEHGDDSSLSDTAPVLIGDNPQTLIPAVAGNLVLSAAGLSRFGYIGKKRFIRLSVVSTGVTTGAIVTILAIQGHAKGNPTDEQ